MSPNPHSLEIITHTLAGVHYGSHALLLDSTRQLTLWFWKVMIPMFKNSKLTRRTYSVDFPAPFAPTIAILDSSPTSKFTFFNMILSGEYPKVTSFACRRGGDILSASGNLEMRSDQLPLILATKLDILELLRFFLFWRLKIWQLHCFWISVAEYVNYKLLPSPRF